MDKSRTQFLYVDREADIEVDGESFPIGDHVRQMESFI